MKDAEPQSRLERTYYPSGQLESEIPYVDDEICGVIRRWDENGRLIVESPKLHSLDHGIQRKWNSDGRLTSEGNYENGIGVFRTWYDNGQLSGEFAMQHGAPHGRLRTWDEGGEFLVEQFFIAGKRVSKKKYREACEKDSSLPRYDFDEPTRPLAERYEEPAVEAHITSTADYGHSVDAMQWLHESSDQSLRTLGELASAEDSIEFVKEFLSSGATRVLAIHVETDDDGSQNTGHLLVELPSESNVRGRTFEFCNEQNRLMGYPPVKDSGQRFVHVVLD